MKQHGMLFKPEMVLATMREIDPKTQTRRVVTFHNSITEPHIWKKEWHKLRWNEARLMSITFPVPDNGGFSQLNLPCWHVPFEEIVVKIYPRVQPGHVIWTRETTWVDKRDPESVVIYAQDPRYYKYKRDGKVQMCMHDHGFKSELLTIEEAQHAVESNDNWKQKPSIHMPRWAARLIFDIGNVRSQRVQEISEDDAKAEGVTLIQGPDGRKFINASAKYSALQYVEPRQEHESINDAMERAYHYRPHFAALWDSINLERGFGWDDNHPVWIYDFKRKEG